MEENKAIVKVCKELGCCDACCIRYTGLKSPDAYENAAVFIRKYIQDTSETRDEIITDTDQRVPDTEGTPAKKCKLNDACISCLGILQEETWPLCLDMVKDMLDEKRYDCNKFACALSAPLSTIIHEKVVTNKLEECITDYDKWCVTPLKEAWKWCFGSKLASHIQMELESGAIAPLLITITMEFDGEKQELSALRCWGGCRRAVEAAVRERGASECAALLVAGRAVCRSVSALRTPLYLGGRYIKTSRSLPQTPWVVEGRRVMESSVQEIIFKPVAEACGIPDDEVGVRLKFMSAGREDVDVRCLGDGRPFAIEITDPRRELSDEELNSVCENITKSGSVRVHKLVHVTKERLTDLKKGEESKRKTYELLCIKLGHTPEDTAAGHSAVVVTSQDVSRLHGSARVCQRTPLRVLHRRPLAARQRDVQVTARVVDQHPQLFVLNVLADAGTYIKEWAHGEAGRSRPAASELLQAPVDILALDLVKVHLDWP